jgi:hypothetical protein
VNNLFNGNQKDIGQYKAIMNQAEQLQQSSLTPSGKSLLERAGDIGFKYFPQGKRFVNLIRGLTADGKSGLDYAGENLLHAMQKATGPDQRAVLMDQLNELDQFKAHSQIVNVPVKIGGGKTSWIQKYLPLSANSSP